MKCFSNIQFLLVFIILLVFLCSCGYPSIESDLNVHQEDSVLPQPNRSDIQFLTKEQMLVDYDYMWSILESNFPYWKYAEQYGRITIEEKEKIKTTYRDKINNLVQFDDGICLYLGNTPFPPEEVFYHIMTSCLQEFNGFGHLRTVSDVVYFSGHMDSPIISDTSDRFYSTLRLSSSTNENASTTYSFQDTEQWVSLLYKNNIPIIQLSSFSLTSANEEFRQIISEEIEQICHSVKNHPHVIIDIRGNSGGSSHLWQHCMRELFAGKDKPYTVRASIPLSQLSYFKEKNQESSYRIIGQDDSLVELEMYVDGTISSFNDPYEGSIWLLVDEAVFSSSELLTRWAKAVDAATVIGETTGGSGGYGVSPVLRSYQLPNSGLIIQSEWVIYYNGDGSINQLIGTEPDVFSEEALETCLKMIENGDF